MNIFTILRHYARHDEITPSMAEHLRNNSITTDALERRTGNDWFECDGGTGIWPIEQMVSIAYMLGGYSQHYAENSGNVVVLEDTGEFCRISRSFHWNGEYYSEEWGDENTFYCDGCGETYDNNCYGMEGMCQSCCDNDDDDDGGRMYSYSTDILRIIDSPFISANRRSGSPLKGVRYFGVEIETAPKSECSLNGLVSEIAETTGNGDVFIMKQDGSVEGPEIVSVPATLAAHSDPDTMSWQETLKAARKYGEGHSGHNCGMHVHVTRSTISQLTIGKLIVFINCEENRLFVETMAQRSFNCYCAAKAGKKVTSGRNNDRYEAVNLQNAKTIELRIFNSTLRVDRMLKNIEFFDCLLNHLAKCSVRDLGWASFAKQVSKKAYPNLHAFMIEKGFIIPKQLKLEVQNNVSDNSES